MRTLTSYHVSQYNRSKNYGNAIPNVDTPEGRVIGRPLNCPTVQLADTIELDWITVKIFSILLCIFNSHRNKRDVHLKCS